jgi:RNA polymerase sigma factor (sigma-70 family)
MRFVRKKLIETRQHTTETREMNFPEIAFEDALEIARRLAAKWEKLEALRAKIEISYEAYEETGLAADATKAAVLAYAGVYKIAPDQTAWNDAVASDPFLRLLDRQATGAHWQHKSARMWNDELMQEEHHESREFAIAALPGLLPDEATVLRLRFGSEDVIVDAVVYTILDCRAILTYEQVGQHLGMTTDQVRSIETDALRKLGRIQQSPDAPCHTAADTEPLEC